MVFLIGLLIFLPSDQAKSCWNHSPKKYGVVLETNIMISMRDGVRLATDIYRPETEGKFPVILVRTPYGSEYKEYSERGKFFVDQGYVFAVQDCRGKYDSEGNWYGKRRETDDGYDTITWLGTQSWSSGKVGMMGGSYLGIVQWQVAFTQNPYLKALIPEVAPISLGRDKEKYRKLATYCNSNNGIGNSALQELPWLVIVNGRINQNVEAYDMDKIVKHLPLIEIPNLLGRKLPSWERLLKESNGHWEEYIRRATKGNWTEPIKMQEDFPSLYSKVNIPILQISGWYDCASEYCFYNLNQTEKHSEGNDAKQYQYVLMGPWNHAIRLAPKIGDLDFGPESIVDFEKTALRWFDRWLKGIQNKVEKDLPVKFFVMGINKWRETTDWPLPESQFKPFYLHSSGKANSFFGDGLLSYEMPENEPPDEYVYDPAEPTPSITGLDNTELAMAGPVDMSPIEERNDVLVYTSAELKQDIEVTGPLSAVLYVSSTAPSTDFFVRLLDVHPNGIPYPVFYTYANPYNTRGLQPIDKGPKGEKILKCEIELPPTSNVFFKRHKIRVEISSSAFPLFRNLNVGGEVAYATKFNVAKQKIFHDKDHPSHIILPVIPHRQ